MNNYRGKFTFQFMSLPFKEAKLTSAYWFNCASDLRAAAAALWFSMERKNSDKIVREMGLGRGFSMLAAGRVFHMICGLSLELLFKSIAIQNGKKPDEDSHDLPALASAAGIKFSRTENGLLMILTEYIYWSGKYPVPKKESNALNMEALAQQYLWRAAPISKGSKLKGQTPTGALDWEGFEELWKKGSKEVRDLAD